MEELKRGFSYSPTIAAQTHRPYFDMVRFFLQKGTYFASDPTVVRILSKLLPITL